jgi:hypothetical protein
VATSAGAEAGRKLFEVWANGVDATLKATFDVENAALEAGISVLEATGSADQALLRQWAEAARQAQAAALEAFRANLRATQQAVDSVKR